MPNGFSLSKEQTNHHAPPPQPHHQMHHHHQLMPATAAAGLHHNHQHLGGGSFMRPGLQNNDFPLRILVQSDMVGAIIGRAGSTIKMITQQSKARIDVHREESQDQQEKVITINGTPESCSAACFKIIEVIMNERASQMNNNNINNNKNGSTNELDNSTSAKHNNNTLPIDPFFSVQLKILAHNNLIGRLIGRSGASIKKIMEQTSTKINVSVSSLADCTHERTITVYGNLDQVRYAEQVISSKLRAAYMSDMSVTLQAMNQPPYLFNNVPISYLPGPYAQNSILSTMVNPQAGQGGHHTMSRAMPVGPHQAQITRPTLYPNTPSYLSSLYPNISVPPSRHRLIGFNPASLAGLEFEKETVNIYIPNIMVGAIIGKSGSAIKEMIINSGASIRVAAATSYPPESAPATTTTTTATTNSKDETNSTTTLQQDTKHENSNDENSTTEEVPNESTETDAATSPQSASRNHVNSKSYPSTRKVTIIGTPESQWTAQYLIYRKVSMENKKSDISLMVEIQVPSHLVGRIIGKGGVTVKQIQKQTRTTIRLPDEKPTSSETENDSVTSVQITGEFNSSQLAQRHIRSLIRENPHSSRQNQSDKQPIQNKHNNNNNNESNAGNSTAQNNFIENHQFRSDNESTSTPEEEEGQEEEEQDHDNNDEGDEEKSTKSNEKN